MNIRQLTYLYVLGLFFGTVIIPVNSFMDQPLSNQYTLSIRWDYIVHVIVYMPLPVLLGVSIKRGVQDEAGKGMRGERGKRRNDREDTPLRDANGPSMHEEHGPPVRDADRPSTRYSGELPLRDANGSSMHEEHGPPVRDEDRPSTRYAAERVMHDEDGRVLTANRLWTRVVLYSILITALFELAQLIVPYRSFNINDLVANGIGSVLGIFLLAIFRKRLLGCSVN